MSTVQAQDLLAVRSRVSWGAIFAGAVTAMAVYLLLSTLGVAIGFSVSDRATDQQLGVGATALAVFVTLVSLFVGGYVASQCSVGENKQEAMIYGVIVWGVVFAMLLWLMAGGIRIGFNAVIGLASTPTANTVVNRMSDEDLRNAGFTEEQITASRAQFERLETRLREAASSPTTTYAAWWTFTGLLLSMLASVAGSLVGSGPTLTLAGLRVRSAILRADASREPVVR